MANQKALEAARLKGLPSIGGSDCHIRGQVGRAFTLLKYPIRTMGDLVLAIRSGHCEGMAAQGGP
jgi:hypothetical protein